MMVYVRWYGKVLEGELLEGESMGMKQVRIPLDGHHPVALFTPEHVYDSVEKMQGVAKESYSYTAPSPSDVLPADDRESIEAFKRDNWDAVRGHLRIDKLDEFYWLWREAMTPFGYVEAENLSKHKSKQCHNCKYWVYTKTLASLDKPEWHCRDGFSPSKDCIHEAEYNDRCMEEHPDQRPADWKPTYQTIVSDERMAELRTQLKKSLKPVEATQLSLFD